jgi:hypothetical protein
LGKYGTAVADPDSYADANAEPKSIDFADSFCVGHTYSDVQRNAFAHVATADPPHVRVPDTDALTLVLSHRERRCAPQN